MPMIATTIISSISVNPRCVIVNLSRGRCGGGLQQFTIRPRFCQNAPFVTAYSDPEPMERPRFAPEREREFIARGWWRDDTLPQWLARHARERPDSQAGAFPGGPLAVKALPGRLPRAAESLDTPAARPGAGGTAQM